MPKCQKCRRKFDQGEGFVRNDQSYCRRCWRIMIDASSGDSLTASVMSKPRTADEQSQCDERITRIKQIIRDINCGRCPLDPVLPKEPGIREIVMGEQRDGVDVDYQD